VEGTVVQTKHGPVVTDFILFIASGAFHVSKPSDLLPELQGRFPIRVELSPLSREDLVMILTEPEMNLIEQARHMLSVEGVDIVFEKEAIDEIADIAYVVNSEVENIGARRLNTIIGKVLENVSFNATDMKGQTVTITRQYVVDAVSTLSQKVDLSRFIL
jgi:ATP-dependent HslUV protease ATP-binding subunit HslU